MSEKRTPLSGAARVAAGEAAPSRFVMQPKDECLSAAARILGISTGRRMSLRDSGMPWIPELIALAITATIFALALAVA
jgi:hypothetical protein